MCSETPAASERGNVYFMVFPTPLEGDKRHEATKPEIYIYWNIVVHIRWFRQIETGALDIL